MANDKMRARNPCGCRYWFGIGSALAMMLGCGSSDYKLVPVSGTVTLDGEPVAGARVIFEPRQTGEQALSAGPSSDGETDETGHYSLRTTASGERGAVAGPHAVTITTFLAETDRSRDTSRVVRAEEIPARYRDVGGLSYEVPEEGSDAANFVLHTHPAGAVHD